MLDPETGSISVGNVVLVKVFHCTPIFLWNLERPENKPGGILEEFLRPDAGQYDLPLYDFAKKGGHMHVESVILCTFPASDENWPVIGIAFCQPMHSGSILVSSPRQ
jgi:hypothetical protein